MPDEEEAVQNASAGTTSVWLVLEAWGADGAISAFWNRHDAANHADGLLLVNGRRPPLLREVVVQGGRRRCRLCGEPVVLDDPLDSMSWIHAEDANDIGDHTAEL